MGEQQVFQPLTREDTITVVFYRVGIVMTTIIISGLAYLLLTASTDLSADALAYCLYASVGLSVFFIHLYVGRFKVYLRNLYFVSLACLVALLIIGKGSITGVIVHDSYAALLLLPLSGCLGFVTAKEAFCFRLFEGYLLAIILPTYLLLVSGGILVGRSASYGLVLIAIMLGIFTLRKVFMPISYDIGDKSAYQ